MTSPSSKNGTTEITKLPAKSSLKIPALTARPVGWSQKGQADANGHQLSDDGRS
jgi:hypothetical protein